MRTATFADPPPEDQRDKRRKYYYLNYELSRRPVGGDDWDFYDCATDKAAAIATFEQDNVPGVEYCADCVLIQAYWSPARWVENESGCGYYEPGAWEYKVLDTVEGGFLWRNGAIVE